MALPDFPDYHKWGFSLTALNNTVYVTGGQARLPAGVAGGGDASENQPSPPPAGPPAVRSRLPQTLPRCEHEEIENPQAMGAKNRSVFCRTETQGGFARKELCDGQEGRSVLVRLRSWGPV